MSVSRASMFVALSSLLLGCPLSSPVVTGSPPDELGADAEDGSSQSELSGASGQVDAVVEDADGDDGDDGLPDVPVNRRRPSDDVGPAPGPEPDVMVTDAAEPQEEDVILPPAEDVPPPPVEDVALPPAEDVVPPPPEEDAPAPPEEDVVSPPEEDVAPPPVEDVALPPLEDIALPEEDAPAPPEEEVVIPEEEDAVAPPVEDTSLPPLEDIAPPEEDIAPPEEDAAPPEEDAAASEEDAAVPEEDAAAPEEDAAAPEEDAAAPEEDAEEPPPPVDPCDPDPCDEIPAPYCDGGVLFEPDGTSNCVPDGEDFSCTYPAFETDCGAIGAECSLGGCVPLIPAPDEGEVVITEMMPEPEIFMNAARWIELRVLADDMRDMGGCFLSDATGASAPIGGELIVEPDEHVVIALGLLDGLVDDYLNPTVVLPGPDDPGGLDLLLEGPEPLRFTCGGVVVDAVDLAAVSSADDVEPAPGTAWQLSAGEHTTLANDDADNWCSAYLPYGFESLGTPGVENFGCDTNVDWCRFWEPAIETTTVGDYFSAYIHIQEQGLTEKTKGEVDSIAGLLAQVGYGPDGEIPLSAPELFEWIDATPEISPQTFIPSSHDRYRAPMIIFLPGLYDLVGRFSLDGGFSWKYCDLDGSGNGYSVDQAGNAYISL